LIYIKPEELFYFNFSQKEKQGKSHCSFPVIFMRARRFFHSQAIALICFVDLFFVMLRSSWNNHSPCPCH